MIQKYCYAALIDVVLTDKRMVNLLTTEFKKQTATDQFDKLPRRIFLDSNVLQYINDFGEFIYDNYNELDNYFMDSKGEIIKDESFLYDQLIALNRIFISLDRAPFEFAISENVYEEIRRKNDYRLTTWFYNVWEYWRTTVRGYGESAFDGSGILLSNKLESDSIRGALSSKDFKIFCDAVALECDAILTCDRYRNGQEWIYRKYRIMILYPTDFVELIKEFEALWF